MNKSIDDVISDVAASMGDIETMLKAAGISSKRVCETTVGTVVFILVSDGGNCYFGEASIQEHGSRDAAESEAFRLACENVKHIFGKALMLAVEAKEFLHGKVKANA